jgi:hypothetical protein
MKKFLIIILFLLFGFNCKSQVVTHQDWRTENGGNWNSFNWGVTRTQYPDFQGKYYYYIYFYSNSFFNSKNRDRINYDKAITYIRNVNVTMDEYMFYNGRTNKFNSVTVNSPYITCDWNMGYYVMWFYSFQPYNRFNIRYDKISAYDYSMY